MRKCPVCQEALIECDQQGKPATKGGWLVCPKALLENQKEVFDRPWERRGHRDVRIEESSWHARERKAQARARQFLLLDASVGRRHGTA